jgi:hypothetical protein
MAASAAAFVVDCSGAFASDVLLLLDNDKVACVHVSRRVAHQPAHPASTRGEQLRLIRGRAQVRVLRAEFKRTKCGFRMHEFVEVLCRLLRTVRRDTV